MNPIKKIKEEAEASFQPFLEFIHKEYPELLLKYPIHTGMRNEYIEALLAQYWEFKKADLTTTLILMMERNKTISKN